MKLIAKRHLIDEYGLSSFAMDNLGIDLQFIIRPLGHVDFDFDSINWGSREFTGTLLKETIDEKFR